MSAWFMLPCEMTMVINVPKQYILYPINKGKEESCGKSKEKDRNLLRQWIKLVLQNAIVIIFIMYDFNKHRNAYSFQNCQTYVVLGEIQPLGGNLWRKKICFIDWTSNKRKWDY